MLTDLSPAFFAWQGLALNGAGVVWCSNVPVGNMLLVNAMVTVWNVDRLLPAGGSVLLKRLADGVNCCWMLHLFVLLLVEQMEEWGLGAIPGWEQKIAIHGQI